MLAGLLSLWRLQGASSSYSFFLQLLVAVSILSLCSFVSMSKSVCLSLMKRCVMVFRAYPDNPGFSILRPLITPAKTWPHKVTFPGSKELGPNSLEATTQPTGTYYCGICQFSFFFFWWPHNTAHRILVPHPGIKPVSPALKLES